MNPKVFVGAAVAGLAVVLGVILAAGPMPVEEAPGGAPAQPGAAQARPLEIELGGITIGRVTERSASVDVEFVLTNPNARSVIVQVLDYQLFETGYSESRQLSGGQIGSRPGGMVEFGSNYYTLLAGGSITLRDTISLANSGSTPELWQSLSDGTASWRITGDVFYNLSSMTSGQENELHFEFTQ